MEPTMDTARMESSQKNALPASNASGGSVRWRGVANACEGDGAGPVAPGRLAVDMLGAGAEGCAYVSVATLSAGFLEGGDGGGGGGGDGGGGGKSYLRIHKGMLSSIAFGSTTGAGGADGSTHGLYGTGTVGAGACVMYHRCVTNGLSQKLSGTVVLTRETFSSLACPWPGSSSYFPSSRSRETFLSSNRRLLSTISSQVCTVETLPPTSVTVRSTRRTKLTRKLSKHAGGWNGNTAQLGGGGDGGEGGGDGVGGGDGGDGGGEGGGHLYTDCSASRSIPGG